MTARRASHNERAGRYFFTGGIFLPTHGGFYYVTVSGSYRAKSHWLPYGFPRMANSQKRCA